MSGLHRNSEYLCRRSAGVSSRGTSRFTSGTSDQLVSQQEQNNCTTPPPPSPPSGADTKIRFTVEGLPDGLEAPFIVAVGNLPNGQVPNGVHTYSVSPGDYTLNFAPVSTNPSHPDPTNTYYPDRSLTGYAAAGQTTDLGKVRYVLPDSPPPSGGVKIRFTVAGLPDGASAKVSIENVSIPKYYPDVNLSNGTYEQTVDPGTISVDFPFVSHNGILYSPDYMTLWVRTLVGQQMVDLGTVTYIAPALLELNVDRESGDGPPLVCVYPKREPPPPSDARIYRCP